MLGCEEKGKGPRPVLWRPGCRQGVAKSPQCCFGAAPCPALCSRAPAVFTRAPGRAGHPLGPPSAPAPSAGAAGSLCWPTQPPSIPELCCTGRAARWGGQDRALPRQPAALGSTAGTARSRQPLRCGLRRQVGAGEESARPCWPAARGRRERGWVERLAQPLKCRVPRACGLPQPAGAARPTPGGAAPRCRRSSDCGCCSAPRLHGENGMQVLRSHVWGSCDRAVPGVPGGALGGLGLGCLLSGGAREPRCRPGWRSCAAGGDACWGLPRWQPPRLLRIPAEGLSCFF